MSLSAYLMHTQPIAMAGNELEVGIMGFTLHREVLETAEHVRMVEAVARQITGQALTIRYTVLSEAAAAEMGGMPGSQPAAPSEPVPPLVQDIVQLFNATVIKPPPA